MTELNILLNSLIIEEFTEQDKYYFENCDDNDKEIFLANKRYFMDKRFRIDALKKVISRRYEYYMNSLLDTDNADELLPTLKKIKEMKKKQEDLDGDFKSNYSFITISPVNTVGWLELFKQCEKFVKLKFVKQYIFVLEQRYDGIPNDKYNKPGDGLHAHLLIDKGDYKPSHLKRDVYRIFNEEKNNINIQYRRPEHVMRTQGYILEQKEDEEKQKKQIYDKLWRQQENIKDYYGTLYEMS